MQKPEDILRRMKNLPQGNTPISSSADSHIPIACKVCGASESICEGLGMVRYDVSMDDDRFGKLFRCPNHPVEKDMDRQDRLRKFSNLGLLAEKRLENFTIDGAFHTQSERDALTIAYTAAQRFAQYPEGWLLFEGSYGCGKTHLAAAIANERIAHGDEVLFITSPDLLDHLRGSYNDSESGYDDTFDRLKAVKLLIIDDLGVENPSPWAKEKLFQLLNHRYTQILPTVITTNADMERLDPRLKSRMLDSQYTHHIQITSKDYRLLNLDSLSGDALSSTLSLYTQYTFSNLDVTTNLNHTERENIFNVSKAAQTYAHKPEGKWFLLAGKTGTGKTHIAAGIANYRKSHGSDVFFISVSDLMDDLRTTFDPKREVSFIKRFNQVKNVSLLVLDDLNMGNASDWAKEKLFQLIDYRYVTQKSTVFTLSDFDRVDERIRVRLLDARIASETYELTVPAYVMRGRRR